MNYRKSNILLLISGRFISMVGSGIQMIALPLYILDTTGSGLLMGIFSMLCMLPMLLVAPLAGVIGDRLNRKWIMVVADYGRGALIASMGLLAFMDLATIPVLFTGQAILAILDSFFNSSSDGIIPDIVDTEGLPKANAMKGGSDSLSMIIGPVLGGIIYGAGSIKTVFILNAVSFVVSGVLEMFMSYRKTVVSRDKLSMKVFYGEIREVLDFVWANKGLKQLFSFAMGTNFLIAPVFFVIAPYVFKKVIGFSSQQFGFLQTFYMLGLLAGNIIVASFFIKYKFKSLMRTGLYSESVFLILLSLLLIPSVTKYLGGASWLYFAVLGITLMIMASFNPAVNIPIHTNLQKMVSTEMRSRFFSVLGMISQLVIPVGSLIYGFLLDLVPSYTIVLAVSILVLGATALFLAKASNEAYEPHLAIGLGSLPDTGV